MFAKLLTAGNTRSALVDAFYLLLKCKHAPRRARNETQNCRKIEAGRVLWSHLVQPPAPNGASLPVQSGSEHLQGWRLHSLSGHLFQCLLLGWKSVSKA